MPARVGPSRGNLVDIIPGGTTSGALGGTLNVNPLGRDRMCAVVSALWVGGVDTTGAAFTATFGGDAMTVKGSRTWDTNEETLRLWVLEDIDPGPQPFSVGFSSMPTEGIVARTLHVAAAVYTGYDQLGALVEAGGSAATANTVTLTDGVEAGRFVSVHAVGKTGGITSVNRSKRAESKAWFYGNLILQDASGGASVAMTATQNSTDDWGALGFPLTASAVDLAADLTTTGFEVSAAGIGIYDRDVAPSPDRYWRLPADPGEEVQ